ncbi:alpha/beta hydrolase family protein [Epibacterium sp. Ofav1-8]|uniref:alpha/beta hydrolase family protein n=1 Tax=Epibacterium sp. Ofav1-8 TaxID=2917735 RepID=UPI001EF6064D|nr:prolyl oligopeptidase family serine peptidase [Epibacterium sp. Ofav1-8]MCG7626137.1 prolyl oligopeptidase family serine peptidase [Epibacterium sp. Ofav1-8]
MNDIAYDCVRLLVMEDEVRSEWYMSHDTFARMQALEPVDIAIMCYGCPSHPFDHSAALMGDYLSAGMLLIYPNYLGTWASDGVCTLENAVETVARVRRQLDHKEHREIRGNRTFQMALRKVFFFGGSFGGSVALVAAAKVPCAGVIAVSPVVDWRRHGKGEVKEEDLSQTYAVIRDGFRHFWRIDQGAYDALRLGQLDLNPTDYIDQLCTPPSMLIHAADDRQVSNHRTIELAEALTAKDAPVTGWFPETGGHLILYHMGQSAFSGPILDWCKAV